MMGGRRIVGRRFFPFSVERKVPRVSLRGIEKEEDHVHVNFQSATVCIQYVSHAFFLKKTMAMDCDKGGREK